MRGKLVDLARSCFVIPKASFFVSVKVHQTNVAAVTEYDNRNSNVGSILPDIRAIRRLPNLIVSLY